MESQHNMDIQAALRKLDSWQHATASTQRRFRRFPVRGDGWLAGGDVRSHGKRGRAVHVRDVSRGGVGVLSSEAAQRGQLFQLHVGAENVVAATLPAFCRYCREVAGGVYLIGLEFGVEASVLLSLGVSAKDIASGDEPEEQRRLSDGEFLAPENLVDGKAA